MGAEEKKLGIRGSSTTQIILENAKVPVENVLGQIGKGHKIAFNVLNVGRFKLGAGVTGAAKYALTKESNMPTYESSSAFPLPASEPSRRRSPT